MKILPKILSLFLLTSFPLTAFAATDATNTHPMKTDPETSPKTTLTWYGHSAFKIVTPKGKVLLIDPWLSNPINPEAKHPLDKITQVDYILLTHGHFDHVGETVAIAKKTKARLVTSFELGQNMVRLMGFPKDQIGFDTLGGAGGALPIADGEVTVNFVQAIHSSGLDSAKETDAEPTAIAYGGNPLGFVIQIKNGPTIYHTGDTAYFSDMELIGKKFHPSAALINIGGHFGMEPAEAAHAAQVIHARLVIPHHYKTFPVITQNTDEFFRLLDQKKIAHFEMKPGQTIEVKP